MTAWSGRLRGASPSGTGLGRRSLRVRLVLFVSVTLVAVCAVMALSTVLVQRVYLLGDLDQRVTDAAERSQGGLQRRTGGATDLGFLNERGQPAGTLAARFADGEIIAAEVVTEDGRQRVLTAAQRAALKGIIADGSRHTRDLPGLGTYRLTALGGDGVPVLAGLPMADVQQVIDRLVVVEAAIAPSDWPPRPAPPPSSYGGSCARWAGSRPPPPRSPGCRWTAARSPSSPGSPRVTPTPAPRPARSVSCSTS